MSNIALMIDRKAAMQFLRRIKKCLLSVFIIQNVPINQLLNELWTSSLSGKTKRTKSITGSGLVAKTRSSMHVFKLVSYAPTTVLSVTRTIFGDFMPNYFI